MGHDEDHSASSVLLAFFLGGIVGAGLALMLAPDSGTETRRKIKEFSDDVMDKSDGFSDGVKDAVRSGIQKGMEVLEEKKSSITSAIEAGKTAYEAEKDQA